MAWSIRHSRVAVALVVAGATSTAGQVLLLRELMVVFSGHELSVGLALAGWLAGVGWGAAAGARQQRRRPGAGLAVARGALLAGALLLPVLVLCVRLLPVLLETPPGEQAALGPLAVSAVATAALAAFPFGLQFPGLAAQPTAAGPPDPGLAYGLEACGALLGGLGVTLALASSLPALGLAWGLSVALCGAAALASAAPPPEGSAPLVRGGPGAAARRVTVTAVALGLLLVGVWGAGGVSALDRGTAALRLRARLPGASSVAAADTRRGRLELARRGQSWLVLSNGHLLASLPDDGVVAPGRHLAALAHPAPRRVLVLSAVPCGAATQLLAHASVQRVDVLSSDPGMPALLARALPTRLCADLLDPRVAVHSGDPHGLLRAAQASPIPGAARPTGSPGPWDLVLVEAGDPDSRGSSRLFSAEFYALVAAALTPGGVLVTSVSASANAASPEQRAYSGSAWHTLRAVFSEVVPLPGDRHTFLASRGADVLPAGRNEWAARRRAREPALQRSGLRQGQLTDRLPPDRVRRLDALLQATTAPINTDRRPVAPWLFLLLWSARTGSGSLPWGPSAVLDVSPVGPSLALLLLAAALALWGLRGRRPAALRRAAGVHMATTGAAGMAGSLVLLQAFQSVRGELYLALGLLVACFMVGLSLASVGVGAWLRRHPTNTRASVLAADLLWSPLLAGLWLLAGALLGGLADVALLATAGGMLVLGAATGASFPLAVRLHGAEAGRSAGTIDAADHMGAAVGALLGGALLLPLFGIAGTLLLVAAVKLLSLGAGLGLVARPGPSQGA